MQEKTRVQSLGWEDPLEKEMATHSGILAWETPWTGEPGVLQPMGSQRVRHDLATKQQTAAAAPSPTLVMCLNALPGSLHGLQVPMSVCVSATHTAEPQEGGSP